MTNRSTKKRFLTAAAAVILLAGGGTAELVHATAEAKASVPAPAPQAVPVGVTTMKEQNVRTWSEFSGRLQAVDYAQVRPEVVGRIVEIRFRDGQDVKAGDILFVIDPRPYQAAVEKAEADLASAQTNTAFAKTELDRANGLIATNAISRSLYDQRANADRVAQAAEKGAVAQLDRARIDLDHAFVKAPISGRVSRAELTVGNLVQITPSAPVLTSIASTGGIYADFDVDEEAYLQGMRAQTLNGQSIPVELTVHGDEGHVYQGQVQSFDNHIDTATGTIRTRAIFDNKDGALIPGMTVSVRVADAARDKAMLVPQASINIDQDKKFVYVVGQDSKVAYREVQLGKEDGDKRIVLAGLKPGDRVIVSGMQHVHPDALAAPTEVLDAPPAETSKL